MHPSVLLLSLFVRLHHLVFLLCVRLSRSTGYRPSDLSGLVEGSTLIIGSKEIEVGSVRHEKYPWWFSDMK